MSGRTRLTVCSALASVMVAGSLLPLVTPAGWLLQAALMVGIAAAAGTAGRRVPLPRPLTVLLQLFVMLFVLVFAFARDSAPLGFVPGPGALARLGRLVSEGVHDVGQYAIPAPVTDGIRLLLVGGVVIIAVIVDALAVTYRNAAPAGLPLLALYSVAAGLAQGGGRWLWFLLAAAGYLMLLLAEGRDRLSRWGRVFAGAPRHPQPGTGRPGAADTALAPVRTGRRIGALALGIALVAPALLPSLGTGLLGGRGPGSGPGGRGSGTIAAVNPLVSLQDSLNQPENREVLRYRTNARSNADMYLRIVALDQFDGTAWKPAERRVGQVPDRLPDPLGLNQDVLREEISTSVSSAGWYRQSWLPLPYPATEVKIRGDWRFEPQGRTLVGDKGQTTAGVTYRVDSLQLRPTARQLAQAPAPSQQLLAEYTRVPRELPRVVAREALRVTRGADTQYQKAMKLQTWFADSGEFTYDTDVRGGTGSSAIVRFLRDKQGFCVHFAFSMAAMSRTLGIPARVAVGFTPGTPESDGSWSVGLRDAHAWPELYFEGVGWVRFEPTPARGTTPDYAQVQTPTGGTQDPGLPSRGTVVPTPGVSASPTCNGLAQRRGDCDIANTGAGPGPSGGDFDLRILAAAVGGLLVIVLPALPMLWRIRERGRRLTPGPPGHPATMRTLAAWQEVVDTAWDYGVTPDESETPRRAVARIARAGGLDGAAEESARRVAASVEQVLYAPEPRPVPGLDEDVERVRAAFAAGAGRAARARAVLLPRSTARVAWRMADAWARVSARWGATLRRALRWRPGRLRPGTTR